MQCDRGHLRAMRLLPFAAAADRARLTLNTATALVVGRGLRLYVQDLALRYGSPTTSRVLSGRDHPDGMSTSRTTRPTLRLMSRSGQRSTSEAGGGR